MKRQRTALPRNQAFEYTEKGLGRGPVAVGPVHRPAAIYAAGRCFIRSVNPSRDFAPVPTDEMAFALTLFVESANYRVSAPVSPNVGLNEDSAELCEYLYRTLCADIESSPIEGHSQSDHHTSLFTAFRTLCNSYNGDPLQVAVCARVLAFHFLMERTAGAVIAEWVQAHPEKVELVILAPVVIEAIATVRLYGSVLLSERAFLELVVGKRAVS